jgi:autotransporter translocation and assembly factor TamB
VQSLKISADLQDPFSSPSLHAVFEADDVSIYGESFRSLSLEGNSTLDSMVFGLSADHENGSRVEIDGTLSSFLSVQRDVILERLFVSTAAPWPVSTISNTDPVRLGLQGDDLTVHSCRLDVNHAALSLTGGVSREGARNLTVETHGIEISDIPGDWNIGPKFSGLLSTDITLNGPWSHPTITSDIRVAHFTGYGAAQTMDVSLTATYRDTSASFRTALSKQGVSILSADGNIPLALSLSPLSVESSPGEMAATIKTDHLKFSELPIPKINGVEWDAVADIDLSLSGDIRSPDILGDIFLRSGQLALFRNKLTYETIEGQIGFNKNRIDIENLQIEGDSEGQLKVAGTFFVEESHDFNSDLTLSGRNFYIPYQKAISARISPELHLTGGLKNPRLTGDVTISESRINLDRLSGRRHSDIQIIENGDSVNNGPMIVTSQSRNGDYLSPLSADIRVHVPKNAWLKGQDVNAEISGELTVRKQPGGSFLLTGPLNTLRGNYYFMGKNFIVNEGHVEFLGLKEINPNLDIEAQTRINSATIIVNLHGTAQEMVLDLSSDPVMEESDIISYLVFGKATDDLGGNQAFSVEKTALNYMGGLLVDELRTMLGDVALIDSFAIDSGNTENGIGAVTLGKYITPELFVSHRQSLSENEESFQEITYELTPDLKLETQVGKDATNSVDLTWEFDF